MAYNDKVVDVTVNLGTQPIDTVGFETPLFVAIHSVFPERVRTYAEIDQMVEDGFAAGSPAHVFATKAFSGKFPPQYIMIGRQALASTTIDFTDKVNVTPDEPVSVTFTSGSYTAVIIVQVNSASTPTTIATDLVAAIEADTTLADVLTATSAAGVVTINPKDDNIFSVGYDAGNYLITNTSSETVSSVLPLIAAETENWYFLSTESHSNASILAAASYATANYKLCVYSTKDTQIPGNEDTSIGAQLKALQYDNVTGTYDPLADSAFTEGGVIGAMASNDPSYGDSLHLKTLPGCIAPTLSLTDRMNIWGQNVNFYRMINGVGAYWEGKCASGQYVDVVRFGHWLKFRTEESVFGYMSRRSNLGNSMKMSDDDLPNLKAVIQNNPLNTGITNGSILTGFDSTNNTFYDPVITIPTRANIPSNELAARTLNNVKIELVYNTPLHFVKIRITVLLDKTGSSSTSTDAGV